MIAIKKVNSEYPTTTLEFPQIIFKDATKKEANAIYKSRDELLKQIFYIDASAVLNTLEAYLNDYPNATFELSVEQEYDDEGYSDEISVGVSSTDENEQNEMENNSVQYTLRDALDLEIVEHITEPVSRETFDAIGQNLLGKKLYQQWKLGKIGLEKQHLEKIINDPKIQDKTQKL